MPDSRKHMRWKVIAVTIVAMLAIMCWATRNSLRHYAAHHASTIGVQRSQYRPGKVVTSLRSDTRLIILAQIVCSDDYLRDEYRRTKDISVFATQQSIYHGSLSTKDCEDELSKGAVGFVDED